MVSSIRQAALNEMRDAWSAVETLQGEFRLAAIWQGPLSLQHRAIEDAFSAAARQAFDSLKILHSVKLKYQSSPEWNSEDAELEGGSLAGLREVFVKEVNARIHEINAIYKTAQAALTMIYQAG